MKCFLVYIKHPLTIIAIIVFSIMSLPMTCNVAHERAFSSNQFTHIAKSPYTCEVDCFNNTYNHRLGNYRIEGDKFASFVSGATWEPIYVKNSGYKVEIDNLIVGQVYNIYRSTGKCWLWVKYTYFIECEVKE